LFRLQLDESAQSAELLGQRRGFFSRDAQPWEHKQNEGGKELAAAHIRTVLIFQSSWQAQRM